MIKEKTFQKIYDYFILEINDILISSNKKLHVGETQTDFNNTIN